jgi:OmpA-OmpF porin, OOP family
MKKIILSILFANIFLMSFAQLENLGKLINSTYEEISPYITPDGSKIFFIREDHPQNTMVGQTQDVWWCKMQNDSIISEAKHLGFPFNTMVNNSINFQSADGQIRFMKGVFDKFGQFVKSGYSYTVMTPEGWSDPIAMNIKKYSKMSKGKYVGMCVSPSANVMILSFSEKKGHDRSELYISKRINDKNWTKPVKINGTLDGDFAPFIASDNKTVYFSSYARGGYGSADIFVMKRLDDTWLNWSTPENLGPKVNTKDWDAYFKVSPSGRYAFMVSSKDGNSDVYRLPLFSKNKEEAVISETVKPDPVIIVEGIVKDAETGNFLQANIEYVNLNTNNLEGVGRSAVTDGSYKVVLPYGSNYSLTAKKQGYYAENVNVDITNVGEFTTIKRDILLKPIKAEAVIRLNNIFFETAKSTLLPTSENELDGLVKIMNENPSLVIEIRGHTDNVGADGANQKLSEERAKSVVDYLVGKGINATRLSSKGFGETQPTASNDTAEGRALNRRVEFRVVSIK